MPFVQEVVRLNELLTARETKLVELSKENVNMRESEVILRKLVLKC